MKSKIKFESSISKEAVNFLDVTVKISDGVIKTTLYSKPTDAHLYLNKKSCHPDHRRNIPKGQFIRVRRICSDVDFEVQAKKMKNHFISRGYDEKRLNHTIETVKKMNREDLLKERDAPTKDPHTVLVCTWHPKIKTAPSILQKNYTILRTDIRLNKIFEEPSTLAFRRRKNLSNHLSPNDVKKKQPR